MNIMIARSDTSFDPGHTTTPANLRMELQCNFVKDGFPPVDASDHPPGGMKFSNHGHGTGTLSLLAGNKIDGKSPGATFFTGRHA
jgi:hypothetical protein